VLRLAVLAVLLTVSVGAAWLAVTSHREEQRVGLESVATLVGSAERAVQAPLARAVRLSDEEEERVGEEVARQAGWPPATEAAVGPHVEGVGALIAEGLSRPGIRYRFLVTESALANAWALPGGRIYVTTGMLRLVDDEAELASVLGHEAAHVDLRHCADRVTLMERADQGLGVPGRLGVAVLAALTQPSYSEEQELEADAAAVRLAAIAGYDPVAAIDLFERLATLEGTRTSPERADLDPLGLAADALDHYFATHPPAADRARALAPVVERALREHPQSPRYRGARNLRERVPFASQAWPEEKAADPSPLAGK
jgi:predicted Zn-dependent protease